MRSLLVLVIALLQLSAAVAQDLDEYRRQAVRLTADYRWVEAIHLLREATGKFPGEASLLVQLGALLSQSGQVEEADQHLTRALQLQPDHVEAFRHWATNQIRWGRIAAASDALSKESTRRGDAELFYLLAFAQFLQRQQDSAIASLRTALELAPQRTSWRVFYAALLRQNGQADEGHRQLQLAREQDPRDPQVWSKLAEHYRAQGQYDRAADALWRASALDPENPLYHSQLARLYQVWKKPDLAREASRQASQLLAAFDAYVEALRLAGRARLTSAIKRLEPAVAGNPGFTTGALFLGRLYQRTGQHQDALALYERLRSRTEARAVATEESAWIALQQGQLDWAIELLNTLERESPNRSLFSGYRELLRRNWSAALGEFRRAETSVPLDARLLQLMSSCLQQLGRENEALQALDKAQRLEPYNKKLQDGRLELKREAAAAAFERKNWTRAADLYTTLLDEDSLQFTYFFNRAYCRQQLGQVAAAISDYSIGLEANPSADWARINLAHCLLRLWRYREAAEQWQVLAQRTPTAEICFQLGLCYLRLERTAEAGIWLEKAFKLDGTRADVTYHLGVLRQHQNRPEEAWSLIRRAAAQGYQPARNLLASVARNK